MSRDVEVPVGMPESHYPECAIVDKKGYPFGGPCFCSALRACEQRRDDEWNPVVDLASRKAFQRGLSAASDAVAALRISPQDWDYMSSQSYGDIRHEAWQEALAAIDALRGES